MATNADDAALRRFREDFERAEFMETHRPAVLLLAGQWAYVSSDGGHAARFRDCWRDAVDDARRDWPRVARLQHGL